MGYDPKTLLVDVYRRFARDDGFPLAGNIAFCTLLSLFPFLILMAGMAALIGSGNLAATVIDYLLSVAPAEIVKPIKPEIEALLTPLDGGVLTLSGIFLVYTAAGGVESLRTGLNRCYNFTETRIWPVRFIQNIAFVIGGAVVMIILALLLVFGPLYWSKAAEWIPALNHLTGWFDLLRYPVSIGLMFIGLTLAHMFLPVERHPLREIMPGIVVTIILWLISAWVYADYLAHFSRVHVVYAGIANAIIALIFLYITAVLWILGGEINQALIAMRQRSGVLAVKPVAED
ncbi:MAG: YihY/virulence factor BrkB family protein [Rhizobiales bacterium]|nr:YihY/virulence factor BrkB family protein [Hyphomicrobiales bacterium]